MAYRDLPSRIPDASIIFLNGLALSSTSFEVRGRYVRFPHYIAREDEFIFMFGVERVEIQMRFKYARDTWFDPFDQHDPKVKAIEPPLPTVTQL